VAGDAGGKGRQCPEGRCEGSAVHDVLGKVEMNNVFCRLCSLKSGFSVVEVGSVWLKWVEVSSVWLKWVQCG